MEEKPQEQTIEEPMEALACTSPFRLLNESGKWTSIQVCPSYGGFSNSVSYLCRAE